MVARARQLLERLVRGAGFGWRDIDRMIQKNRGFTAHLMSKREGLPLNELLAILDAIEVEYEDFFAVLLPQFDKMRHAKPIGGNMADLLGEKVVAEAPVEIAAKQDERAHAVWGQLDKINALIDQRVLLLLESALAAPVRLPPRPETATPAADSKPALPEGAAGEGLV